MVSTDELNKYLREMTVLYLDESERSKDLKQKRSYWSVSQHDHLTRNWGGGPWRPGSDYIRARQAQSGFIPVNASGYGAHLRRPDCPVPIGRQIAARFTEMVIPMSDGQTPNIRVWGDEDTQEYLKAVFKTARIWESFMYSRDMCGSQGCSAILCGIHEGTPYVEVLDPACLWIPEWDDSTPWFRPKVVVEQTKVTREIRDSKTGRLQEKEFWSTRAWTDEHTVRYEDVAASGYKEAAVIPVKSITKHPLGRCPVVWYANCVDLSSPYGEPDYDGVYENMDQADRLESQIHKSVSDNTDPTVVVREDRRSRKEKVIERGKVVGVQANGDVKYLEITGSSIDSAQKQLDREMEVILQTVQCVIISMSSAAKMQSSESLQMLWRSMEARSNRLRTPLLAAVEEVCDVWCKFAEEFKIGMDLLGSKNDQINEGILLPPRAAGGNMTPHKIGNGGKFSVEFSPFFRPTPQQIASVAAAMSTATAAKQFISTETATKTMCGFLAVDGTAELGLIEEEYEKEVAELEEELEGELKRNLEIQEASAEASVKTGPEPGAEDSLPSGNPQNPIPQDPVTKPAAKAKRGKRGPAKG
jgi:hypothetical protein